MIMMINMIAIVHSTGYNSSHHSLACGLHFFKVANLVHMLKHLFSVLLTNESLRKNDKTW